MKKLFKASLLATGVLLASQAQADTFSSTVNGSFSQAFVLTPQTTPGTSDANKWFRFAVTANTADFNPFSYSIFQIDNTSVSFSGVINPVGGKYQTGLLDKTNLIQDFSSDHTYSLTISGLTKSAGDKAFILTTNSFIASVPEPESYAMLLAGLGLLGFMARRRQAGVSA
jgi:hypothetical protein